MYKSLIVFAIGALLCVGAQGAAVDSSNADLVVEMQKIGNEEPVAPPDVSSVPEDCHQPKETGRCFALFYRYAYNVDTGACEEFIYGGCAGNKNNFETKELCERACVLKSNADPDAEKVTEAAEASPAAEAESVPTTEKLPAKEDTSTPLAT
ncbi:blackelin-4 [Scaptodrosophila lebanonensis]|uniref:Blackelin-4 n=1 Tax=Drosophila lebanonensis TaxID=7225 RepID=A0A6J2U433_DROLE|nr:blackelin-4 [Scaptodrosophila lebanonensis]